MVDFSKLLKQNLDDIKRPPALPVGTYGGIIKGYELREAPAGKNYSAIVSVQIGLTSWDENVDEGDKEGIDLTKRSLRKDYYDNALVPLKSLLESCGVEIHGRVLEEALPELTGKQVQVEVQQYQNRTSGELGNQVGLLAGA
jgi:hypothetical protein